MEEETFNSSIKKRRAQWTSQQMEEAVKMVESGILSTNAAAFRYNIPRRTLNNHLQSGSTIRKLGRSAIFTTEQEDILARSITRIADIGVPMSSKMLLKQAFLLCKIENIPNTFNDAKNNTGQKWLRLFLKRHPELAHRRAQIMNPARAQKLNKDIANDHFSKYKEILDRLGIEDRPETIYSIDKKKCHIGLDYQEQIPTTKGKKKEHQMANEDAESVTVISCANAIGSTIPPMIIFKDNNRKKPECQDNLLPDSLIKMTPKGNMTTETFVEFIDHLNKFRASGPCLLIFDSIKFDLDFNVVEEADKLGITLYCLPLITTEDLQPMHKFVHPSFDHHWDQELNEYVSQHPERTLNKTSFNVILSQVWPKCMTVNHIINGFRITGLYPYNPDAIPEEAFTISKASNPITSENVVVLLAESKEEIFTESENVPLSWLSKKYQNALRPKPNPRPIRIKHRDNMSSWYCSACKSDRIDNMRQCLICDIRYHECVGLTVDENEFYCSGDCLKKKTKKAD